MKRYIGLRKPSLLPDFTAKDLADIDFAYLKSSGIKAYFFDLDHTVLVQKTSIFNKALLITLKQAKIDIYIATNRKHSPELERIAKSFGAKAVMSSSKTNGFKPRKKYYRQLIELSRLQPGQILMTGDRIIQDIYGANRLGINTLLVEKLGEVKFIDKIITLPDVIIPVVFGNRYENTNKLKGQND